MKIKTSLGVINGIDNGDYLEFRGIRYGTAERFEYPKPVTYLGDDYDATKFGPCCFQKRAFEDDATCNAFYHKEFREGLTFEYSEDCLVLNVYAPKNKKQCPVIVYIHGGSFTGGSADEGHIDGKSYAQNGIVFVAINYRLGPWGFAGHSSKKIANFGLADRELAIKWVLKNIADFGGNPKNVCLLGRSAGAMSVDIQLSNLSLRGKISSAVMMSGAGLRRLVAKPVSLSKLDAFWESIMEKCGAKTFDDLKTVEPKTLFYAWLEAQKENPLNVLCTLPVRDGRFVGSNFNSKNMPKIPLLLGITITDMMPIALERILKSYAKRTDAFLYSFDRLLPGDNSGAWHSCDLLYAFKTLKNNWRPFTEVDEKISDALFNSIVSFARYKNPNNSLVPTWKTGEKNTLHFAEELTVGPLDTKAFFKNTFSSGGAKF